LNAKLAQVFHVLLEKVGEGVRWGEHRAQIWRSSCLQIRLIF